MKNMKFRVRDEEHSKQIQEALFTEGYGWGMGLSKEVDNTYKLYLYTDDDSDLFYGTQADYFDRSTHIECELYCGVIRPVEVMPQPTRCPPMPAGTPPLGLKPRYLVEAIRLQEIISAMARYAVDRKQIPHEWIEELISLNERATC